jgi:N-acylneuraminate cytidylyltransferase
MVWPGKARRPMPQKLELIVLDFDGVLTDNQVWTDENGREMVSASRSDSLHLATLRGKGLDFLILSSEPNPVVTARAQSWVWRLFKVWMCAPRAWSLNNS